MPASEPATGHVVRESEQARDISLVCRGPGGTIAIFQQVRRVFDSRPGDGNYRFLGTPSEGNQNTHSGCLGFLMQVKVAGGVEADYSYNLLTGGVCAGRMGALFRIFLPVLST